MPCGVTPYCGWCIGIGMILTNWEMGQYKQIQSENVIVIDDMIQDSKGHKKAVAQIMREFMMLIIFSLVIKHKLYLN